MTELGHCPIAINHRDQEVRHRVVAKAISLRKVIDNPLAIWRQFTWSISEESVSCRSQINQGLYHGEGDVGANAERRRGRGQGGTGTPTSFCARMWTAGMRGDRGLVQSGRLVYVISTNLTNSPFVCSFFTDIV